LQTVEQLREEDLHEMKEDFREQIRASALKE
jgi:hypothetical protein